MILTGRDIQWYIEQGKLSIAPVMSAQFQQNGIDLILDQVKQGDTGMYAVRFAKGEFYLACTREIISMPDDLMAFVELRSTWARSGLILPPTVVDAGSEGNLTLEIAAFAEMKIPLGEPFAHLIFARLTGPTTKYAGRYQHQRGITGSRGEKS